MEITRIPLTGLNNTRDLGGFPTLEGLHIYPKKLLRSGNLGKATPEDIRILREEYDLSAIIDFRTKEEASQMPDPEIPGVSYIPNSIFENSTLGITRENRSPEELLLSMIRAIKEKNITIEQHMDGMYENLVCDPYARAHYRRFFHLLMTPLEGAYLWHCTAGKDRVGVGTALLLSALNVDRELILKDHMMTEEFSREELDAFYQMLRDRGMDEFGVHCVEGMFGLQPHYLSSAFEIIDERFGGIDAYLEQEMGLDAEKRAQLKAMYCG